MLNHDQQPQRSSRPSAVRMRRLYDRRRRGFRCVTMEICDADVDRLVARGFLDRIDRHDDAAVDVAIARLLEVGGST
jgi:hypothetical protein